MKPLPFYLLLLSTAALSCHQKPNEPSVETSQQNLPSAQPPASQVTLKTLSGKDTLLSGIVNNKASVFIFLSPECPLSQGYSLTLNEFTKKYKINNIHFYGIFPGTQYPVDEIIDFQKKYNISFTLLLDPAYRFTRLMGATITPEAFVISNTGQVLYSGRIDNWAYEVSKTRQLITEHNLQDAIESIINNSPIAISKTKAVGCFIEQPNK